jgi:hypothetical protein
LLTGKNILLVSPQSWDSRQVSKQHYTKALAEYGANVFYLNPPTYSIFSGKISYEQVNKNLTVVSPSLPIPRFFKFKLESIFRYFLKVQLNRIIKRINSIDFLWNLDNGTYFQEHYLFENTIKIFHPVDDFNETKSLEYSSYDFGFSVSNEILAKIPLEKKWFINHGLNAIGSIEESHHLQHTQDVKSLNVCYLGNLSIRFLDTEALKAIIGRNVDVAFHFIGDYDEKTDFVVFLENSKNVTLYGKKIGTELHEILAKMDIFLLCYKKIDGYFADNSHKVLEYLSTGNVIVSSQLSVYKELNLFPMSIKEDNSDYIELFEKVVRNFSELNNESLRQKRIAFALDNTYAKQIQRIERHLEEANM